MQTRTSFYLSMAFLLLPVAATAADAAPSDLGGGLLQLVLGFMLILALLFATRWVLKKLSVSRGAPGGLIRVISAAAVGPRERVVVVDVGGKRLVLGVAPGQVSLLSDQLLPPDSTSLAFEASGGTAVPEFAQWLKRTIARRNEK